MTSLMEALHAKGYITEPRVRAKSVHLTDEGMLRAKQLAEQYFGKG